MTSKLKAVHQNVGAALRDGKPAGVLTLSPVRLLVQRQAAASQQALLKPGKFALCKMIVLAQLGATSI